MAVQTFVFLLCCMIGDSVSKRDLLRYATMPSERKTKHPIIMHVGCKLKSVNALIWEYMATIQITDVAKVTEWNVDEYSAEIGSFTITLSSSLFLAALKALQFSARRFSIVFYEVQLRLWIESQVSKM